MESVGKIIRARRERLGLSQQALAALSGVATSTIRNIEADRVDEARTWRQVELTLGWGSGSLDVIRRGDHPDSLLAEDALVVIGRTLLKLQANAEASGHARDQARESEHRIAQDLGAARSQHADSQHEKSKSHVQFLEEQLSNARNAAMRAEEDHHMASVMFRELRDNYDRMLESLALGADIAAPQAAPRTYSFLAVLAVTVSPVEVEIVLNALDPVIAPAGWARLTDLDVEGGWIRPWLSKKNYLAAKLRPRNIREARWNAAKSGRLREAKWEPAKSGPRVSVGDVRTGDESKLLEEAAKATEIVTGTVDQVMIPIMVDKKDLDGLDNDDFVSIVNLVAMEARHMLHLVANAKRRERAKQGFESESEWPPVGLQKEGDG